MAPDNQLSANAQKWLQGSARVIILSDAASMPPATLQDWF